MDMPLNLDLQASPAGLPLSKKISEAMLREIQRGRFRPGDRVPSSRTLSESLHVHRNTVLAAYDELIEQGYIETRAGQGTFVATNLPLPLAERPQKSGRRTRASDLTLRLAPSPKPRRRAELGSDTIALLGGFPDLREAPLGALSRAYRAAIKNHPACMDYQSEFGQSRLIAQLGAHLARERGVAAEEGEMLITRGSQQAIHLAGRALAREGSVIAVERSGYPPAWEALRMAGAELVPIRVDKNGVNTDELQRLCQSRDVSAVYVTPHHQYPTTVTMSAARRMALLKLARDHEFVIIEDDYDHEYHFSQHPVLPLASADHFGTVLHIGTLSKVFAPGLRLGYAVGHPALIEHMAASRTYLDRQGDHATELAMSYLIEDGELSAHIRKMRRVYIGRREAFFSALERYLGDTLTFKRPAGGLAVWAKVEGQVSASQWADKALQKKVLVQDAKQFFFDGRARSYLRLGYARHTEAELEEGVKRLAASRPRSC